LKFEVTKADPAGEGRLLLAQSLTFLVRLNFTMNVASPDLFMMILTTMIAAGEFPSLVICVEGDVIAIPGPVSYSSYSKLSVNGVSVIYEARCTFTFTFTGVDPSGSPVSGTEDVSLSASSSAVNASQSSVLLDGDSKSGTYGNQLQVVAPANPAATT
jgi:hypothetical protein